MALGPKKTSWEQKHLEKNANETIRKRINGIDKKKNKNKNKNKNKRDEL